MKRYSKQLLLSAKKIKLIATDIDGVLTSGEVILLENNEEIKIWNVKDRLGIHLLQQYLSDVKVAWITGRQSKQVSIRAKELSIDYLVQSCKDKNKSITEIANKLDIDFSQIAYIGDDIIDIPVLKNVGLSVCPKDAVDEAKRYSKYISKYDGGKGVFREVCEILMKAQNVWDKVIG